MIIKQKGDLLDGHWRTKGYAICRCQLLLSHLLLCGQQGWHIRLRLTLGFCCCQFLLKNKIEINSIKTSTNLLLLLFHGHPLCLLNSLHLSSLNSGIHLCCSLAPSTCAIVLVVIAITDRVIVPENLNNYYQLMLQKTDQ